MRTAFLLSLFLLNTVRLYAQPEQSRPLIALINTQDPSWPLVQSWIASAKNKVQVLPKSAARADSALLAAQVTTRSPMGAVIYETGGIIVDNGWLRILGSGSPALNRDLMGWNKNKQRGLLLIADDALGGFFALNGGGLSGKPPSARYTTSRPKVWNGNRSILAIPSSWFSAFRAT